MNKTGSIFNSLEKILLPILVFLLPTQLGYHFWPEFSYVFGIRVDYLAPTVFLTDILIFVLFVLFLLKKPKIGKKIKVLVLLILGFAAINTFFAGNVGAAFFKWLRVGELIFLGYYVYSKKALNIEKEIVRPLGFSLILFSVIGFLQFVNQKTLGGIFYFLGERNFTAATPGVALTEIFGKSYLRAYSTFSHPNSFAAFLGASLIFFLLSKGRDKAKALVFSFALLAILLSFSLGAFISLFFVLIFYLIERIYKPLSIKFLRTSFFLVIIVSFLFPLLTKDALTKSQIGERYRERVSLAVLAEKIFSQAPVTGVGLNNFIGEAVKEGEERSIVWRLQPPHNIFLLVAAETGVMGLFFFASLLSFSFSKAKALKEAIFLSLLFILISAMFDHHWLTLIQNQLLFSILLGLSFRKKI
jgi:O-antigen ligase